MRDEPAPLHLAIPSILGPYLVQPTNTSMLASSQSKTELIRLRATTRKPLRVINGPDRPGIQLPLCPRKRTQVGHRSMSGLGPQPDSCTAAMTKRWPHSGRPAAYKARVVISSQSFGPEPRRESPRKTLAVSRVQARPSSLPGNERRSVFRSFSAKALKSRSQCQVPPLVSRARRRRLRSLWRCAAEMRRESPAILPCPRSRHSG